MGIIGYLAIALAIPTSIIGIFNASKEKNKYGEVLLHTWCLALSISYVGSFLIHLSK